MDVSRLLFFLLGCVRAVLSRIPSSPVQDLFMHSGMHLRIKFSKDPLNTNKSSRSLYTHIISNGNDLRERLPQKIFIVI